MNLIHIADTPQVRPVTQKDAHVFFSRTKPQIQQPGSLSARVKTAFENREYDEKYEK